MEVKKMKKTIYVLAALALLMAMTETAFQDYRAESWKNHSNTPVGAGDGELNVNEKCVYDVKPWGYTVWGVGSRYSDGSIKCAIPGDSKRKRTQITSSNPVVNPPVDPPVEPPVEPPVCHTEETDDCSWVAQIVCAWKKTGNHWTYQCHNEPHHHQTCETIEVCE
jgi:hypothetical protein